MIDVLRRSCAGVALLRHAELMLDEKQPQRAKVMLQDSLRAFAKALLLDADILTVTENMWRSVNYLERVLGVRPADDVYALLAIAGIDTKKDPLPPRFMTNFPM